MQYTDQLKKEYCEEKGYKLYSFDDRKEFEEWDRDWDKLKIIE